MTLLAKVRISSVLCIVFFIGTVVTTFVDSQVTNLFLVVAVVCGTWAVKWNKELSTKEATPIKQPSAKPPSILRWAAIWTAWTCYGVITLSLFWLGISRFYQLHLFAVNGIKVSGIVISKEKIPSRRQSYNYYVTYEFWANTDKPIRIRTSLDTRNWFELKTGDSIPIKYLPGRPWESRLDDVLENQDEGAGAFFTLCTGIAFLIFGIWQAIYVSRKSKLRASVNPLSQGRIGSSTRSG